MLLFISLLCFCSVILFLGEVLSLCVKDFWPKNVTSANMVFMDFFFVAIRVEQKKEKNGCFIESGENIKPCQNSCFGWKIVC